jgi:alpha-beta hydrolase superfamily lysophospholipase
MMLHRTDPRAERPPITIRDVATASPDGISLQGRAWSVAEPRAVLLIAHGLGEHGGSYARFAQELASSLGIEVASFDFRGSGRSGGRRGFVRTYDELTADLVAAIDWAARERPGLPRFLMGHSNGGLVAIRSVQNRALPISGLILSNPSIRLSIKVPGWKLAVAEVLRRLAPRVTLPSGLNYDSLTRDPEAIAAIEQDTLRHDRVSAPLYFGMSHAGPEALSRAGEIKLPTLMLISEADPIIDPASGRMFFEKLGTADKTLRSYPGMRHEPLNELGREAVVADIERWLSDRLG